MWTYDARYLELRRAIADYHQIRKRVYRAQQEMAEVERKMEGILREIEDSEKKIMWERPVKMKGRVIFYADEN